MARITIAPTRLIPFSSCVAGRTRSPSLPIGDFRVSVVRTVMRALSVLQGKTKVHFVANTAKEGIKRLLEATSASTPGPVQPMQDLQAPYQVVG